MRDKIFLDSNILLYDKAPDLHVLVYPNIVTLVFLVLALFIFKKANTEMTDVL